MISTIQKTQGFTIIEAIVSMALFAIAFSGLYFFFGMAQQANNNSEKRMYLNLMGNQILETIHAEAFRGDDDVANPFVTPTSYTANLSDCSTYTAPDVRHTWCTELDASIGPHKGVHADEVRTVEVIKDETNLIVNVTLVADGGTGSNNLIKTFLSRKIAPPRRSTPPEACVERHNTLVAKIKSDKTKCDAGTVPFISVAWTDTSPGTSAGDYEWKVSCPDYKTLPDSTLPYGLVVKGVMTTYVGRDVRPYIHQLYQQHLYWNLLKPSEGSVIYDPYYWSAGKGSRGYSDISNSINEGNPGSIAIQGMTCGFGSRMPGGPLLSPSSAYLDGDLGEPTSNMYQPNYIPFNAEVTVVSCCSSDKNSRFSDGRYYLCDYNNDSSYAYRSFTVESVDWPASGSYSGDALVCK